MRISYQYTCTHSGLIIVAVAVLGCTPDGDLIKTETGVAQPPSPPGNQAQHFPPPVVISDIVIEGPLSDAPGISAVTDGEAPADSTSTPVLLRNAPNPFNPATTLSFAIPEGGCRVVLAIHCVNGRRVRQLVATNLAGGEHTVIWRGCDDSGRKMPSGVYFACLRSGNEVSTRKLVMVQ